MRNPAEDLARSHIVRPWPSGSLVLAVLLIAACGDGVGPTTSPNSLNLAVTALVDSATFRSKGEFLLDLVPSDNDGHSFVADSWTIATTLTTPTGITAIQESQTLQPADTQPVAAAILIDDSGSMRFSDPDRQRAISAQLFWTGVLAARPNNSVALLDFGQGGASPSPGFQHTRQLSASTSDKGVLDAVVDQIQSIPGGGTPLYQAADEVITWIDSTTPASSQRTLVVVTDGVPSDGAFADSLFADALARRIRIFSIGVGAAADLSTAAGQLTKELAIKTGGIYGAAEPPMELQAILRALARSASPDRLLVLVQVQPAPLAGSSTAGTVRLEGLRGVVSGEWSFTAP